VPDRFVTRKELESIVNNLKKLIGTWAAPTGGGGSGDMLKSVYDKDNDGVVDNSEKIDGRAIYVSDNPPTSADGKDGDLWFEY